MTQSIPRPSKNRFLPWSIGLFALQAVIYLVCFIPAAAYDEGTSNTKIGTFCAMVVDALTWAKGLMANIGIQNGILVLTISFIANAMVLAGLINLLTIFFKRSSR